MTDSAPQGFSWSVTRHGAFADCERAYFFNYYLGTGKAIAPDPRRAERARWLKQLTSLPMWVGSHVHEAIEGLLRRAVQGAEPDVEAAIGEMVARMRRDYADSKNRVADRRGDPRAAVRFSEHEYDLPVAPADWKRRVEEAQEMVRAFAAGGTLDLARGLERTDLMALEELEKWTLGGATIFVKLDFAYRDTAGDVQILDWKTGKYERGQNPLQLMSYALFAHRQWGTPLEKLRVREVYLRQQDPDRWCEISAAGLADAETRIQASIAQMLARLPDPQRNAAEESAFALAADERPCAGCFYRQICPRWAPAV